MNDLDHIFPIVMLFEVKADAGKWTQTGMSPQAVSANKRHFDGANYLFADGHVKWLKPERATNEKPNGNNYTFRLK